MLNIDPTNLEDVYLWFDIDRNKMHLKYDGEHYICDNYLFNRCKEMSLQIRDLRLENEILQRKLERHNEEIYRAGYDDASKEWHEECRQLRDSLRAILDRGETPEDSGSKADRG